MPLRSRLPALMPGALAACLLGSGALFSPTASAQDTGDTGQVVNELATWNEEDAGGCSALPVGLLAPMALSGLVGLVALRRRRA